MIYDIRHIYVIQAWYVGVPPVLTYQRVTDQGLLNQPHQENYIHVYNSNFPFYNSITKLTKLGFEWTPSKIPELNEKPQQMEFFCFTEHCPYSSHN